MDPQGLNNSVAILVMILLYGGLVLLKARNSRRGIKK
jgi:hypothetical protein